MSDRMEAPPRPSRAPVPRSQMPRMQAPGAPRRNRRRWAIAAAVTVCWVVLWTATGSLVGGTLVLLFLAGLGVVTVLALRALGVTRDHPWVRQIATRPWRDGQEVLQLALRHLPEVFVVTPSGTLLAPTAVELRLNPRDFGSLGERMDIGLVETSAAEVYNEQVAAHGARLAGPGPVEVSLISDPSVPEGRYQLRQGLPLGAAPPVFQPAAGVRVPAGCARRRVPAAGRPRSESRLPGGRLPGGGRPGLRLRLRLRCRCRCRCRDRLAVRPRWPDRVGPGGGRHGHDGHRGGGGLATVAERPQHDPGAAADHRGPGLRDTDVRRPAGRGAVELGLPDVPTVSRSTPGSPTPMASGGSPTWA